ncbi:MAG: hypothetical protein Hyperionvirus42_9 [Hyperionvirus sp.]|uniref:Beta-propeller repeat protein n=1 Tax=Hyperionvirus sp. TaxID=2487770 RepID=A0A3G5AG12_9VIRU|nr:MAG: hypothetical protein Hyperionvirus42_9 [Hyperionvirus sp.]
MSIVGNRVKAEWIKQSHLLTDPETTTIAARSVACDNEGNIYTVGFITGSAKVGHLTLTPRNPSPFITKQNSCGAFIYTKTGIVASGLARCETITVDNEGFLYVAGTFQGDLKFSDLKTLHNPFPTLSFFTAKFNSATGEPVWATASTIIDSGSSSPAAITHDDKYLYLTGGFTGTIAIGSKTLFSPNGTNVFTTKLTKCGKFKWSKQSIQSSPPPSFSFGNGIFVNCHQTYVIGVYNKDISFDTITLLSNGINEVFIIIIDSLTGEVKKGTQTKSSNGTGAVGRALVVDSRNNIYATGFFHGETIFGNVTFTSPSNVSSISFISKLKDLSWIKTVIPDTQNDPGNVNRAIGIVLDEDDSNLRICVTGSFIGNIKFGNIDPLISAPNTSFYLTRLSKQLKFDTAFQSTNLNQAASQNFIFQQPISLMKHNVLATIGIFTGALRTEQLLIYSNTPLNTNILGQNFWISKLRISD